MECLSKSFSVSQSGFIKSIEQINKVSPVSSVLRIKLFELTIIILYAIQFKGINVKCKENVRYSQFQMHYMLTSNS